MKQEAIETKKQEELRQEELIKARKEEREEREKRLESGDENRQDSSFDSVEISEEGKYQAELAAQASPASGDIPGILLMIDPGKPQNRRPSPEKMWM